MKTAHAENDKNVPRMEQVQGLWAGFKIKLAEAVEHRIHAIEQYGFGRKPEHMMSVECLHNMSEEFRLSSMSAEGALEKYMELKRLNELPKELGLEFEDRFRAAIKANYINASRYAALVIEHYNNDRHSSKQLFEIEEHLFGIEVQEANALLRGREASLPKPGVGIGRIKDLVSCLTIGSGDADMHYANVMVTVTKSEAALMGRAKSGEFDPLRSP